MNQSKTHPRAPLLALCTIVPLILLAALSRTCPKGAFALIPQITALPPIGNFHDLRWLFVYHNSIASFIWETLALLTFRTLLTASLIKTSWPADNPSPTWRQALSRSLIFTSICFLVFAPLILLMFAAASCALTWPWFGGIIPAFIISLFMHPWVITGDWKRLPTLRSISWIILTWLALTLAAAAIDLTPHWAAYPIIATFGLFNAYAWSATTPSLARAKSPLHFRLTSPIIILGTYGALLAVLHLTFSSVAPPPHSNVVTNNPTTSDPPPTTTASTSTPTHRLLFIQGLGTSWSGGPLPDFGPDFKETIFSYKGLAADGHPLPYQEADTRQPLPEVANLLEKQIQHLTATNTQPLDIICISEGSLATQIYLATHPNARIDHVVIASPILTAALVYFPREGQNDWGAISGYGLHGWLRLFELFGWQRPNRLPVLRSMLEHGPVITRIERCPMNDTPETVLMPLASSVMFPLDLRTDLPTYVVGLLHGDILNNQSGKHAAHTALNGKTPEVPAWKTIVACTGRAIGSAWRVPPLSPTLPPTWQATLPKTAEPDCPTTRHLVRQTYSPPNQLYTQHP